MSASPSLPVMMLPPREPHAIPQLGNTAGGIARSLQSRIRTAASNGLGSGSRETAALKTSPRQPLDASASPSAEAVIVAPAAPLSGHKSPKPGPSPPRTRALGMVSPVSRADPPLRSRIMPPPKMRQTFSPNSPVRAYRSITGAPLDPDESALSIGGESLSPSLGIRAPAFLKPDKDTLDPINEKTDESMTLSELLPKIGPGRPEPQLSESNDSIDSVDSLGSSAMISSDDPTGIRDVVLGAQAPHPRREIQDLLEHLHQMGITETRQQLTQQIEAACSAPITSSPDKSKAVDQIRSKMTAKRNEYSSFVSKQQSLTQMSLDTAIKKLRELDLREQEAAAKLRAEEEARKKKEEAERQALEEAKRKEQEELTRKKEAEQAAAEAKAKEKELQERQKAEAAAKAVAEAKQKADAEQAKMAGPIVPAQGPHSESSVIATVTAWKMASACLQRTEHVKKVAKPATFADAQAKNKIFMVRMMVTRSVGQVTNSRAKVNEVSKTIDRAFTEARAININALEYILDFTAKQFVLQAEKEVAVKHSMAFPIARVCLLLCKEHPEFVELLMGRLIKRCSYVVPMYYPKLASESSTDWQKRAGFRPTGDGETLETEIQYGERMNGILAFYLALVQLTDVPNPFGVGYLWTWLARILNLKPRRLTPTFLQTFLEIGGYAFMAEYQSQANKIMRYMIEVYIPQIPAQAVAATTRLNITLEDCAKRGSVAKPEGSTMDP